MGFLSSIGDALSKGVSGILGGTVGAVGGFLGQKDANESNERIAAQNSAFNALEAQKQRDWASQEAATNREFQAYFSNSAYSRAVTDMMNAGLNPMLAYQQGGASSPSGSIGSGAAATAVQPAPMLNKMAAAAQVAQSFANVEKTEAETRNVETDTEARRLNLPQSREYVVERQLTELSRAKADLHLSSWEGRLVEQKWENAIKEGKRIEADTGIKKVDEALKRLEIAGRRAESEYWREVGKGGVYWREGVRPVASAVGAAAAAAGVMRGGRGLRPKGSYERTWNTGRGYTVREKQFQYE